MTLPRSGPALLRIASALAIALLGVPASAQTSAVLFPDRQGRVWQVASDGTVSAVEYPFHEGGCGGRLGYGTDCPVASPDHRQIAFTREGDLWLYDLGTREARQVTHVGEPMTESLAAVFVFVTGWSPDAASLLYHVDHRGSENHEGTEPDRAVRPAAYGHFVHDLRSGSTRPVELGGGYLAWLPGGELLVSSKGFRPLEMQLMRFRPGDPEPNPLSPRRGWYGKLQLSADGRFLLGTVKEGNPGSVTSRIVRIELASGEITHLTPAGGSAEYQYPRSSPSGRRVAYLRRTGVSRDPLYSVIVDGRPIYSRHGAPQPRYRWIGDDSIAVYERGTGTILVLDGRSGRERGRHSTDRD